MRNRLAHTGISKREIGEFRDRHIIAIKGSGRQASISRDDADLLHAWARLKAVGISPERGFMPGDITIIEDAISRLVRWEVAFFTERYAAVGGEEAARVVEEALPSLNQIISIVHLRKMFALVGKAGGVDVGATYELPISNSGDLFGWRVTSDLIVWLR